MEIVSLFQGRTLSALGTTQLIMDPDLPIAHELRKWYLEEGMNIDMTDLTIQPNKNENSKFMKCKRKPIKNICFIFLIQLVSWKPFGQLAEYVSKMSSSDQNEIFRIKAVCTFVRHDPVYKVKN